MVNFLEKLLGPKSTKTAKKFSPAGKYRPYLDGFQIENGSRDWPDRRIVKAPVWCSVDLRDGNQALKDPMTLQQKLEFWELLLKIGFKEIELGFPSASAVEYEFTRFLIENGLIPVGVTPQVLVQARDHLLEKTFESLVGAKRAVIHLYNSTSELQRRVVFNKDRPEIVELAVKGVQKIKTLAGQTDMEVVLEYSPESFTGTEIDFAVEICEKVCEVWQPTPAQKIVINLPATVEMATPNIYADQIELFCRNFAGRDSALISLHPHNDRGTAVAAAELGLMAGADRIEGTLFGNGERTGNVDLITLALNMYSQGIDPDLDLSDINEIKKVYERTTGLQVPPRQPYGGELVFTAFSGSHQDAISKGLQRMKASGSRIWEVPYLPIDPADIGRKYEPLIRINSQSGKGGVAFVMEMNFGYHLPRKMQPEFSAIVQQIGDKSGSEVSPQEIWEAFVDTYLNSDKPYTFQSFTYAQAENDAVSCKLTIKENGQELQLEGVGNGPIDAATRALYATGIQHFNFLDYHEHALSSGADAEAACYIQIQGAAGERYWGVGRDANTTKAGIRALISALNRLKRNSK